ncbi:hypothetical protein [Metabacillus litoralis]|uniref:hypothetical protein n=1 Tax=Metabacillus litoralis TaxID=152268 RepID=UPI00203ED2FE|nr:hypothetical protein [Metabacillus litoralis]
MNINLIEFGEKTVKNRAERNFFYANRIVDKPSRLQCRVSGGDFSQINKKQLAGVSTLHAAF